MADVPHRTVRIVRDTCSPLWVIRCVKPCTPEGWCQIVPRSDGRRVCWLGSALDRDRAARLAERVGYTVEDGAAVTPPAAAGARP